MLFSRRRSLHWYEGGVTKYRTEDDVVRRYVRCRLVVVRARRLDIVKGEAVAFVVRVVVVSLWAPDVRYESDGRRLVVAVLVVVVSWMS